MYNHPIIIWISILFFLFSSLIGCEGKTKAVAKKPKVVSQKINGKQELISEIKTSDPVLSVVSKKNEDEHNSKINHDRDNNQFKVVMVADHKNELIPSQVKSEKKTAMTVQTTTKNEFDISKEEEKQKAAELLAGIQQQANLSNGNTNDLDTLVNPFLPLFSDAPSAPKEKKKKERDPKELTPLEKVDLSQLKLVATLRADSGNKALVEDSTGKGYVVNKGTFIGINSGSVVEITSESIVVEEEIETLAGDIKVQKREIKLQKAPGE